MTDRPDLGKKVRERSAWAHALPNNSLASLVEANGTETKVRRLAASKIENSSLVQHRPGRD